MPLSRPSVGTYPETSTHKFSENIRPQSSQLAEPLWTDPGVKSAISVREQISTNKKQTKTRRQAMSGRTFFPNPRKQAKKPAP